MGTVNSHWWNRPLNCWWKAVQSITCYSWILSVQLNVHLNWLKIELQSLKCCICWTVLVVSIKFTGYFALCITQYNLCEYSHTNSESLAQMRVTLLKYRMFSRGLFCTVHCFLKKARHLIFDHNFCKCWPIFEILLLVTQNYFLDLHLTVHELEYLAVYGRASMGVPVGELQYGRTNGSAGWPHASTMDCDWSAIGPPTHKFFLSRTEAWLLDLRLTTCEKCD